MAVSKTRRAVEIAPTVWASLRWLEGMGGPVPDPAVFRLLLAIGMHETNFTARAQYGGGPAHGFWQFEQGGVMAVLFHPNVGALLKLACLGVYVEPNVSDIWRAIEGHDALAVVLARLCLLPDPHPIPTDEASSLACYLRVWRPGKPRESAWTDSWNSVPADLSELMQ